ncbi:SRPBCC family protein [uncultured Algibacter sp.]|uniref:SRPBCC family protein n=1 Tax=uncultured Algibacter sp. TaxID=298659 RepID=UPI00260F880A|nr:SRPBCC family protein [uncultured Algibacter sp.]
MKFVCAIEINKPIIEVAKHFEDPQALKESQKDFIRVELISGVEGEAGAKCKLVYKKFDLIETIIHNKLPNEFYATYEHKSMTNTMLSKFTAINKNKTKLDTEIEYLEFKGFVIKLIAKLFPNMFKNQVDKWLVRFKAYCEKV